MNEYYEAVTTKVLRRQYDGKDIAVRELIEVTTKDGKQYAGNLTNVEKESD